MKNFKLLFFVTLIIGVFASISSCKKDDNSVNGVTLNTSTLELSVGQESQLVATVIPSDADNKNVSWSTNDSTIVSVNKNGNISAIKIGSATITVTTVEGSKTASCYVTVNQRSVKELSGNILTNRTLYSDTVYLLSGPVMVKEPATLTIQAGTIIKGKKSSTRPCLVIERGAKIDAVGTAQKPIVFTSDQPKGQRAHGDWGGIIICGKAKINPAAGYATIEGGIDVQYGGNDDNDSSGKLQFVRIEFSGIPFEANKEINGLTMGGVGKNTIISHIQVSYCGDDAYEWFGGNVNCKYLVSYRTVDDEFDTDYGYTGMVQYAVSLKDPAIADAAGDSNGFESDNDADGSSNLPITQPIFSNVSFFGPISVAGATINSKYNCAARLRRNTKLSVHNSVFAGYPNGLFVEGTNTQANYTNGDLKISNCIMSGMNNNFKDKQGEEFDESTIFNLQVNGNRIFTTNDELLINDAFNLSSPNFVPKANSPVLTGASFTGFNSFFNVETFVGAFGTEDWTQGWCNFDPQNTEY